MRLKYWLRKHWIRSIILGTASVILIIFGMGALWVATLPMPDLHSFENRKVVESTKIYDRTGTILLYDTGKDARRTEVKLDEMSPYVQKATIAIEDEDFYTNIGVEPLSFMRAVFANITSGKFSQGASTITQQVVKNSLLTKDKTISRKIKEWVLAVKLTRAVSKEQILEIYLNEAPYGGTLYGVEEASHVFFGRPAKDLTLGQSAYLAAIPQAPTYYSPYGTHRDALDNRQRLVLSRMRETGMITDDEYKSGLAEKVEFLAKGDSSIRAPHFVMYVIEYLSNKYGEDQVNTGGLRVVTTLDYSLQEKAEDVITRFAPTLENNFNASNTAMVAIDPKTGDILTMVGSRDYFDKSIDGNFNVTLAKRQPGSTFKPFVYATLFQKGYTPETILFDVETEFSTRCTVEGKPKNPSDDPEKVCYSPVEFDNEFPGPMTARRALAQSRNIPAVKALYLAGTMDAIENAERMGITTLTDPNRYGLTLVLGGGEISLLELTSAYGVFANDGIRNAHHAVLEVSDNKGNILEKSEARPTEAMSPEITRQINDILSDNLNRLESLRPIADSIGRPVAIKTGTTNDFRDVWTVGYTPNIVVGAWAGKNDNTPMKQNIAGLIISPVWGAFMTQAVEKLPVETFRTPPAPDMNTKPVLHGVWQGGRSYWIDTVSGKLATEYTPQETKKEMVFNGVHDILHWVDKDDPRGPIPANPAADPQYEYWEHGVRKWFDKWKLSNPTFVEATKFDVPAETDNVHGPGKEPKISIVSPTGQSTVPANSLLTVQLRLTGPYAAKKTEAYLNGRFLLTSEINPLSFSFVPADIGGLSEVNTLSVTVYDTAYNKGEATIKFSVE